MMKIKQHESPEFKVIRQNEANAKFFVASFDGVSNGEPAGMVANTYGVQNVSVGSGNSWF